MENPAVTIHMSLDTQDMEIVLHDLRLPINKARKKFERLPRLLQIEKRRQTNADRVGQPMSGEAFIRLQLDGENSAPEGSDAPPIVKVDGTAKIKELAANLV